MSCDFLINRAGPTQWEVIDYRYPFLSAQLIAIQGGELRAKFRKDGDSRIWLFSFTASDFFETSGPLSVIIGEGTVVTNQMKVMNGASQPFAALNVYWGWSYDELPPGCQRTVAALLDSCKAIQTSVDETEAQIKKAIHQIGRLTKNDV